MVDRPDQRPRCNIIIGRLDHIYIAPVSLPCVSRIARFGIDGFYNIIRSVERLIPDQLNLHGSVRQVLHHENGYVLLLITIQGRAKNDTVNIPINIIRNCNIINEVVTIHIQIIDHRLLTVQVLLKFFQGL
jgi:hypothetical protein